MSSVRALLFEARWSLLGIVLLSFLGAGLGIAVLSFLNEAMARATSDLDHFLAAFSGLVVLAFLAATAARTALHSVGHRLVYRLRRRLVKRLLDTDIERVEAAGGGRLIAMLDTDIRNITIAFVHLPELLYGTTLLIAALIYLGVLSLPLFLTTLLWMAVLSAVGWIIVGRINHHIRCMRESDDSLHRDYLAMIQGRKELALNRYRARRYYEEDFDAHTESYRRHVTTADIYNGLLHNTANVLVLGLIGVVFYLALALGWAPVSVAATYALTILFLRAPLVGALAGTAALSSAYVSLRKIDSLDLAPYREAFERAAPSALPANADGIALCEVAYRYPERNGEPGFGVGPLSFSVRRGEIVFVIGGNGSGKSTLARLLTGLYRPHAGRIEVDGMPVNEAEIPAYRHLFSAVFTEFHLFTRLLTGTGEDAPNAQVDAWLRELDMDQKAGHAGGRLLNIDLSQGQRKRLALALALLEQRDFILLDEWAADQDPHFRRFFYRAVLPKLRAQGKAIVAMTHDDHYFDLADRIVKMNGGDLTELSGGARVNATENALRATGTG